MFNTAEWERVEEIRDEIRFHGPGKVFGNRIRRSAILKEVGDSKGAQQAELEARKVLALATN